jgi:hypothetical protein
MKIKNFENYTPQELKMELDNGARFVMYTYTISVILLTFKRPSDIYFIRSGEGSVSKGIPYTLLSAALGWWGIPWGPVYTIGSIFKNLNGGRDVTNEVLASFNSSAAQAA